MSNNIPNFFNTAAFSALGDEQRKAMTAAFDAMSSWRHELATMSEKNNAAVFDKMAGAAKSLGWPTEFVEMSRHQMQNVTKMQTQAIDQVMDVWQKQATQPAGKMELPSFPAFAGMPSFTGNAASNPFAGMPGMPDMSAMGAMNPMQMWMQAAEMWQKNWQQAMSTWMEAQNSMVNKKPGSGR